MPINRRTLHSRSAIHRLYRRTANMGPYWQPVYHTCFHSIASFRLCIPQSNADRRCFMEGIGKKSFCSPYCFHFRHSWPPDIPYFPSSLRILLCMGAFKLCNSASLHFCMLMGRAGWYFSLMDVLASRVIMVYYPQGGRMGKRCDAYHLYGTVLYRFDAPWSRYPEL